jgi:hypothetical protein
MCAGFLVACSGGAISRLQDQERDGRGEHKVLGPRGWWWQGADEPTGGRHRVHGAKDCRAADCSIRHVVSAGSGRALFGDVSRDRFWRLLGGAVLGELRHRPVGARGGRTGPRGCLMARSARAWRPARRGEGFRPAPPWPVSGRCRGCRRGGWPPDQGPDRRGRAGWLAPAVHPRPYTAREPQPYIPGEPQPYPPANRSRALSASCRWVMRRRRWPIRYRRCRENVSSARPRAGRPADGPQAATTGVVAPRRTSREREGQDHGQHGQPHLGRQ